MRRRGDRMFLFLGFQLLPLGYGTAYLVHSIKKKRWGQTAATAVLLLVLLGVLALLLQEFYSAAT